MHIIVPPHGRVTPYDVRLLKEFLSGKISCGLQRTLPSDYNQNFYKQKIFNNKVKGAVYIDFSGSPLDANFKEVKFFMDRYRQIGTFDGVYNPLFSQDRVFNIEMLGIRKVKSTGNNNEEGIIVETDKYTPFKIKGEVLYILKRTIECYR